MIIFSGISIFIKVKVILTRSDLLGWGYCRKELIQKFIILLGILRAKLSNSSC